MNACYIHINWDSMKHVSVERNLGLKRDVVAICDMGNGVEICIAPDVAKELAQMMTDVAEEIEREERAKQKAHCVTSGLIGH